MSSGTPRAATSTACGGRNRHTDPGNGGTGWDWDHYMALVRGEDLETLCEAVETNTFAAYGGAW